MKRAYQEYDVFLGGADTFLMGTFTWADGTLMTIGRDNGTWAEGHPKYQYGKSGNVQYVHRPL
jgi:hypothetical protein